jgi:putative transposase
MARPVRVEFEGAAYHVTSRGNRRRANFRDDTDRRDFLQTVGEACDRFSLKVAFFDLLTQTRFTAHRVVHVNLPAPLTTAPTG